MTPTAVNWDAKRYESIEETDGRLYVPLKKVLVCIECGIFVYKHQLLIDAHERFHRRLDAIDRDSRYSEAAARTSERVHLDKRYPDGRGAT